VINLLKKCKLNNYEKLIEWLDKNNYFIAPASTNFHSNFLGGLVFHSLTVYDLMCEKNSRFNLNLTEKEIIVASLFHDLCKIINNKYMKYEHGLKSVKIIEDFFKLTSRERNMITYHMGPFSKLFLKHQFHLLKTNPEVLAFHTSDYEASVLIEMRYNKMKKMKMDYIEEFEKLQEDWKNLLREKNYSFKTLELFCFELKRDLDQVKLLKTVENELSKHIKEVKKMEEERTEEKQVPVERESVIEEKSTEEESVTEETLAEEEQVKEEEKENSEQPS